jgi:uncharacterized membrane protein YczE
MAGLNAVIPIRFGTLYVIVNALLLVFALVFDRTKIGIATFINLFFLGYIVDFGIAVCQSLFPEPSLMVRVLILAAGLVLLCMSSSLYMTADLGVSTYDAIALVWADRQKTIPFSVCRVITDAACIILGAVLTLLSGRTEGLIGGVIGIGTVITAFFMGPLISWFNDHLAGPLLAAHTAE